LLVLRGTRYRTRGKCDAQKKSHERHSCHRVPPKKVFKLARLAGGNSNTEVTVEQNVAHASACGI
jgi:hypothetical protein